jgi:Ppx/GppA phosphatase family
MAGAEVLTYGDDGNQMPCACVDIGTNTTRLLVAELDGARVRELVAVRRFLRLVPGEDGAIPAESVAELAAIVAAHVRRAHKHGVSEVRAVGTEAVRGARNRDDLCAAVHEAAGVHVEVLSAEQEAALAFAGALATLGTPPAGPIGVIDVGGGSSELVTGTARDGVTWWTSLPIGSGTLAARHLRSDPPALDELAAVRAEIAGDRAGPRRGRQRHDAGGRHRGRARAGDDRAHPRGPDRRARLRGGQAAGAPRRARAGDAGGLAGARGDVGSVRPGALADRAGRPARGRRPAYARRS